MNKLFLGGLEELHSFYNRYSQVAIKSLKLVENNIKVVFSDNTTHDLNHLWIRDSCKCKICFHEDTNQRNIDTEKLDKLETTVESIFEKNGSFLIEWKSKHKTILQKSELEELYRIEKQKPNENLHLWDSNLQTVPTANFLDLNQDDAMLNLCETLEKYGFILVQNTPYKDPEDTKKLIEKISPPMQSIFGSFFDFTGSELQHGDTAYTNVGIGSHTDATYSHQPIGLQFFHCIQHEGTGGESYLVDGFNVGQKLKNQHPETYKYLKENEIDFYYDDDNNCLRASQYIFKEDRYGNMIQFCWNNYDRLSSNPFRSNIELEKYYQHIKILISEIKNPENEYKFKLTPGNVLITKNWRVTHARNAFTGTRRLLGAYIKYEDFENRFAMLKKRSTR